MNGSTKSKPIEILLVEDNTDDVELTVEALKGTTMEHNLSVVQDGVEAMEFLHKSGKYANAPRPDLIILDLKLPKKDGHEVLVEIKADRHLKKIPVIILTTSKDNQDILKAYDHYANCYVTKPIDLNQLLDVAKWIENWLKVVKLPKQY